MTGSSDRDELGELAEIRRELREMRWHLEDAALRREVSAWIEESHAKRDADTAREYVERELNELLANNEMYHAPDLERPEDGFPARCEGCEHVRGACPVLKDGVERTWRQRKLAEASSEHEARQIYQATGVPTSTVRSIPELLAESGLASRRGLSRTVSGSSRASRTSSSAASRTTRSRASWTWTTTRSRRWQTEVIRLELDR